MTFTVAEPKDHERESRKLRVVAPDGRVHLLAEGGRLTFGRATPHRRADMMIQRPQPDVSKRAGEIVWTGDGVRITNLSRKHSLYVSTGGGKTKLPKAESDGPSCEFVLRSGSAQVGARVMFDDEQTIEIVVPAAVAAPPRPTPKPDPDPTVTHPLVLDPNTKHFLVALLACQPLLLAPMQVSYVPRVPELARRVIKITNAFHLDAPEGHRHTANQVHEHLKTLKAKLVRAGLADYLLPANPTAIAGRLVAYEIMTEDHLTLLEDQDWIGRQEDLWWRESESRES